MSISIDKKKADWEKTLQEEQLPWHNFLDDGSVADLYKVSSIPAMYLIDAEGVMVGENLRGEALAKKLSGGVGADLEKPKSKKAIKESLESNIVSRYYFNRGAILQQLKDDKDLKTALEILADKERYEQLLKPVEK